MAEPSTRRIRYGIIGYGFFAEHTIAGAIQESSNSELVAIQKRSLTIARQKADERSIPHAFSSPTSLVACPDVDAVFIASANVAHHEETTVAARAGKHVLVEKPMAMNAGEARAMIDECEKNQVKLMVGHVVRFSPVVERIRRLVLSGDLGRIITARADYLFDAGSSRRTWICDRAIAGGGPVFDIGVHCLDTLSFVLDDTVQLVHSQLSPLPTASATERTATLSLHYSKGTVATITCSFEAPARHVSIEVIGTDGIVQASNFAFSTARVDLSMSRKTGTKVMRTELLSFEVPNLYVDEVTAFSNCILHDSKSPVPGIDGWNNQRVLDLALEGGGFTS